MRAATDKDIQDNLRKAVEELRGAANRIQGKEDHGTRNTMLLLTGITLGILFNPMTGPQTRQWLMDKITGESSDDYSYTPPPARPDDDSGAANRGSRARAQPTSRDGLAAAAQPLARSRARRRPRPRRGRRARARASPARGRSRSRCRSTRAGPRPAVGAVAVGGTGGAQPRPAANETSSSRRHALRYGYGLTTPS